MQPIALQAVSTKYEVRSTEYGVPSTECAEDRNNPLDTPYSVLRTSYSARWLAYFIALLLGGFLLVAHGCHGDEDNELFAGAFLPPVADSR